MANSFQFETFVSKYLYDPEFKKLVEKDIKAALISIDIQITPQIDGAIDALKASGKLTDLSKLASVLDKNFVGMF